jgi:hypothetical protein
MDGAAVAGACAEGPTSAGTAPCARCSNSATRSPTGDAPRICVREGRCGGRGLLPRAAVASSLANRCGRRCATPTLVALCTRCGTGAAAGAGGAAAGGAAAGRAAGLWRAVADAEAARPRACSWGGSHSAGASAGAALRARGDPPLPLSPRGFKCSEMTLPDAPASCSTALRSTGESWWKALRCFITEFFAWTAGFVSAGAPGLLPYRERPGKGLAESGKPDAARRALVSAAATSKIACSRSLMKEWMSLNSSDGYMQRTQCNRGPLVA